MTLLNNFNRLSVLTRLLVIVTVMVSMVVLFKVYVQFQENRGVCWSSNSRLSDEQLYQQAMSDYIEPSIKGYAYSRQKWYPCKRDKWNCRYDAWMAPPMDESTLKQAFRHAWKNKMSPLEVIDYFQYQPIPLSPKNAAGPYKIKNNAHTLAFGLGGPALPSDCCQILTTSDVSEIKHSSNEQRDRYLVLSQEISQQPHSKYLVVGSFYLLGLNYRSGFHKSTYQDGYWINDNLKIVKNQTSEDASKRANRFNNEYIELTSCGKLAQPRKAKRVPFTWELSVIIRRALWPFLQLFNLSDNHMK